VQRNTLRGRLGPARCQLLSRQCSERQEVHGGRKRLQHNTKRREGAHSKKECPAQIRQEPTSPVLAAAIAAMPLVDFIREKPALSFARLGSAAALLLLLPWLGLDDISWLASLSALCFKSCPSQCRVVPTRPLQACIMVKEGIAAKIKCYAYATIVKHKERNKP